MNPSALLSGIRSVGNELTFGALPYIAAAPMVGFNRLVGGQMTYRDAVDAAQGVLDYDQQVNPMAVLGGQVLSAAAPMGALKIGAKHTADNIDLLAKNLSGGDSPEFYKHVVTMFDDDVLKEIAKRLPDAQKKHFIKAFLRRGSVDDQQVTQLKTVIDERDKMDAASRAMVDSAVEPMQRLYGRERLPQVEANFLLSGQTSPVARSSAATFEVEALSGREAQRLLGMGMPPQQVASEIAQRFGTSDNKVIDALMMLENPQVSKVQRQQNLRTLKGER